MAKWVKRFLSLAAVCGAVAGVVYYFKKQSSDQDDEFADDFEDEAYAGEEEPLSKPERARKN